VYEDDDIKEAIRRLSENLYNHRVFCIKRASDLTMRLRILPKEQRTNYEEEKFHLKPHPREVIWERKGRAAWAKK
uniref:Cytochrome b-c1 complex subunit 7 n=1 Tax=Sus scrofa TaxID=9823 RepID=A0A8W4FKW4_PIG